MGRGFPGRLWRRRGWGVGGGFQGKQKRMGEMRRPSAKLVFSAEDTPDLRSPRLQQVLKWEKGNGPPFMPILQTGKTEAMGPKANFSGGGSLSTFMKITGWWGPYIFCKCLTFL